MSTHKVNSLGFGLTNNVYISVVDSRTDKIKQEVLIHNKATRNMVTGLLRFMSGHFTDSYCNEQPQYNSAKNYIPCFIGFGNANIKYNADGTPSTATEISQIPELIDPNWSEYVYYTSTKLEKEVTINKDGEQIPIRNKISIVSNSYQNEATADMDGIYINCTVPPGTLNGKVIDGEFIQDGTTDIFLTEIGLFSSNTTTPNDLLAYIRLSNYTDTSTDIDQQLKTRILHVKPTDTIIIRWVISIAAIGKDSILHLQNIENEYGQPIENNVVIIPELEPVEIVPIPD